MILEEMIFIVLQGRLGGFAKVFGGTGFIVGKRYLVTNAYFGLHYATLWKVPIVGCLVDVPCREGLPGSVSGTDMFSHR